MGAFFCGVLCFLIGFSVHFGFILKHKTNKREEEKTRKDLQSVEKWIY